MTPSHAYNATLSLLITSWHIKNEKEEVVQTQLLSSSFKHDLMKVVQTQLLSLSFKHDLIKVVQTQSSSFKHNLMKAVQIQLHKKLFNHNSLHRHNLIRFAQHGKKPNEIKGYKHTSSANQLSEENCMPKTHGPKQIAQ